MTSAFANVAVDDWFPVRVVVQVGKLPEQPPDQPLNDQPVAGEAVRITDEPTLKLAVHVPGQAIP